MKSVLAIIDSLGISLMGGVDISGRGVTMGCHPVSSDVYMIVAAGCCYGDDKVTALVIVRTHRHTCRSVEGNDKP